LVLLAVVGALIYSVLSVAWSERRFEREGVRMDATVFSRSMSISHLSRGFRFMPLYYVEYAFVLPDGRVIMGKERVTRSVYESLEDKGPVPVDYLPGRPNVNRIGVSLWGRRLWWWPAILTVALGVVTFKVWRVWREAAAALRGRA